MAEKQVGIQIRKERYRCNVIRVGEKLNESRKNFMAV